MLRPYAFQGYLGLNLIATVHLSRLSNWMTMGCEEPAPPIIWALITLRERRSGRDVIGHSLPVTVEHSAVEESGGSPQLE